MIAVTRECSPRRISAARGRMTAAMRGLLQALAALLVLELVMPRANAQAGIVIVELSMPPAAKNLPAGATKTGPAAAAQRIAHLPVASAEAAAEQRAFRSAAAATGLAYDVLHAYRYVRPLTPRPSPPITSSVFCHKRARQRCPPSVPIAFLHAHRAFKFQVSSFK